LSKTDSHPIDHPYRSFVPLETVVEGEEVDDVAESSSRPKNSQRGKRKRKRRYKKVKRKQDSEKKDAAKRCCVIS